MGDTLNVKCKIIKLPAEIIGINIYGLEFGNNFFNMKPKAQFIREKLIKNGNITIQSCYFLKKIN